MREQIELYRPSQHFQRLGNADWKELANAATLKLISQTTQTSAQTQTSSGATGQFKTDGAPQVSRWHEQIGDPPWPTASSTDWSTNAHRIEVRGDSMRKNRKT